MKQKVIALIEENTGIKPISEEMSFEQLGMDSLDFQEMIVDLRMHVGPITMKQAQDCHCVADILRFYN